MSELGSLAYSAGALLLVLGGALKLVDPSGTVGALRAFGPEVDDRRVRVLAGAEVVLGALAIAVANVVVAVAVAVSFAAFAAFVVAARFRDLPIDSCGCLGRLETPPGGRHVVVLVVAMLGAVSQVVESEPALLERLADDGTDGVLFTVVAVVLTGIAVAVFLAGRRPSAVR